MSIFMFVKLLKELIVCSCILYIYGANEIQQANTFFFFTSGEHVSECMVNLCVVWFKKQTNYMFFP